jgi:hypothetical protein
MYTAYAGLHIAFGSKMIYTLSMECKKFLLLDKKRFSFSCGVRHLFIGEYTLPMPYHLHREAYLAYMVPTKNLVSFHICIERFILPMLIRISHLHRKVYPVYGMQKTFSQFVYKFLHQNFQPYFQNDQIFTANRYEPEHG